MTVVRDSSNDVYQLCDLLFYDGTMLKEIWIGYLQIISQ